MRLPCVWSRCGQGAIDATILLLDGVQSLNEHAYQFRLLRGEVVLLNGIGREIEELPRRVGTWHKLVMIEAEGQISGVIVFRQFVASLFAKSTEGGEHILTVEHGILRNSGKTDEMCQGARDIHLTDERGRLAGLHYARPVYDKGHSRAPFT